MYKITMIFDYANNAGKAGGWSESWYRDGSEDDAIRAAGEISKRRAFWLPSTVEILGSRIQLVGGRGRFLENRWPGVVQGANAQDVPQMAALLECSGAGVQNVKRYHVRGLPDSYVVGGSLDKTKFTEQSFTTWMRTLIAQEARFRAINLAGTRAKVASIDANGNVVLLAPLTFNVNDAMSLLRVRNSQGKAIRGTYYVETKVDGATFKLRNWTGGVVTLTGEMRAQSIIYPQVSLNNARILGAAVRKVGRPFVVYRGRARTKK